MGDANTEYFHTCANGRRRKTQIISLDIEEGATTEQLSEENKIMLDTPFSEAEVAKSINGLKLESAPGPNGFSVTFFRKFWGLVKGEIMKMV
jgi:hypothetical protein